LNEELLESIRENQNVHDLLATAVEERVQANSEFELTRKELDSLKHLFSQSEQARSNLQQEKEHLESAMERIELEWKDKQENAEQRQKELRHHCGSYEMEILDLRSKLKDSRSKLEQLGKEIAVLTALNKRLEENAEARSANPP
ncbi:MAG: hypothetical protein ACRERV_17505, partial [Methylococcales bacterium]